MAPSALSEPQNPLLNCPNEIIEFVVEATTSATEKCSLCLVNQRIRTLAQRILFKHIEIVWRKNQIPPIVLLLRSLLDGPHLADEVKHLALLGNTFSRSYRHRDIYLPGLSRRPWIKEDRFRAILQKTTLEPSQQTLWISLARDGRIDAFVALLLLQLRNLSHLDLGYNFSICLNMVGFAVQAALAETDPGAPRLQNLRRISVGSSIALDSAAQDDNRKFLLRLFCLPSIEKLTASFVKIRNFPSGWPSHTPDASNLRTLDFELLHELELGEFLKAASGLTVLRWTPFDRQTFGTSNKPCVAPVFDLDILADALAHVGDTLKELTITSGPFPRPLCSGTLGDVWKNMRCLETLTVPSTFIEVPHRSEAFQLSRQESALSRSLRHVTLTDAFSTRLGKTAANALEPSLSGELDHLLEAESGYAIISRWLRNWEALTPRLRTMGLFLFEEHGSLLRDHATGKLRGLGLDVGVDVSSGTLRSKGATPPRRAHRTGHLAP